MYDAYAANYSYEYYGFFNGCFPMAEPYALDPSGRWVAATNGALAALLNSFVFTAIVSDTELRGRPAAWLILNQCVVDGLVGFMLMVMATVDNGKSKIPTRSPILDELMCRMWESSFAYISLLSCSTYNTVMMAVERYIKIVHPLTFHAINIEKLVKQMIMATWFFGLFAMIVLFFNAYVDDGICCAVDVIEHLEIAMAVFDIGYLYIVPLCVFIFCYSSIAYSLLVISRRRGPMQVSTPNPARATSTLSRLSIVTPTPRAEPDQRQVRVNTAFRGTLRTMASVAVILVVCWTTEEVMAIWNYTIGFEIYNNSSLVKSSKILLDLNCLLNPLVYLICYTELRRRLLTRIKNASSDQKLKPSQATLSSRISSTSR